tara:strand:+ start:692 stop:1702 length:1011 start_codon:yes stop_codon:yes gene_type:complete
MTQPTTRATLKDYAKRQLGHPVVELNLDDDQMEDRIDDALEFFQEYHFDGTYPKFVKRQITASTLKITSNVTFTEGEYITGGTSGVRATVHEYHSANTTIRYKNPEVKSGGDGNTYYANTTTTFGNGETITGGTSELTATTNGTSANAFGDFDNQYISIDENVIGIKSVIPFYSDTSSSSNMFSVNYQYALNDLYTMGSMSSMKNYTFSQQRISMIHNLFHTMPRFRFNRHMDRLYLDIDWGTDVKIDDWIVAEAYAIVDPTSYSDVWGDLFLKKYVTSLFKKQWGQNLIKFEGMQLPGGITLNGRQLYDDANTEIERIEEEVQLKYQLPDDFMVG